MISFEELLKGGDRRTIGKADEVVEMKWHLALLVCRLNLTPEETGKIWQLLTAWATDKKESRIVMLNSVQGLVHILQSN